MPRRKRNRKGLKTIAFLLLIIIAGVVWWKVYDAYFAEKPAELVASETEKEEEADARGAIDKNTASDEGKKVKEKKEEDYIEETNYDELTGVISYMGVNNGKLTIRTSIDQYVAKGTCGLILMQNGSMIYTETVWLVADASTMTCGGFDIDVAGFSSGETEVVINLVSDELRGRIEGRVGL